MIWIVLYPVVFMCDYVASGGCALAPAKTQAAMTQKLVFIEDIWVKAGFHIDIRILVIWIQVMVDSSNTGI